MELYYEGTKITNRVIIREAIVRDVSGGRRDSADIIFGGAGDWYAWGPNEGDRIELTDGAYSSGIMYVAGFAPEGRHFRILASAAPERARQRGWGTYQDGSLEDIMKSGAAECGMEYRIFGLDKNLTYKYLQKKDETHASFLDRLAGWEGAVLKCWNGRLTMIGIEEAQKLPPMETLTLKSGMEGVLHVRKNSQKIKTLTIRTPYAQATAEDINGSGSMVTACLPAWDTATARRWARGLLLTLNRRQETLTLETKLHTSWTAMARLDITGGTDADGAWIIDEAEHDLKNRVSRVKLLRCMDVENIQ